MWRLLRPSFLRHALARSSPRRRAPALGGGRGWRTRLALEPLEGRLLPSVYTVVNANGSGAGSLSAAVALADSDTSGTPILIDFAAGPGQTFATAQTITPDATLDLTNTTPGASITIAGPAAGLSVSGNNQHTVFKIEPGVTAALTGLTVLNGLASVPDPGFNDSVRLDGGGIFNEGDLALSNSALENNTANYGGGGLYSFGKSRPAQATLINVNVSGNAASRFGGTPNAVGGGGLYNDDSSTMALDGVTVAVNDAQDGSLGGGALNFGKMVVSDSSFYANIAEAGGGLFNDRTLTVVNSTFANNDAQKESDFISGEGSGLYNGATAAVYDSTFSGNAGTVGLGFSGATGGGGIQNNGTLTLENSIVAGNTATNGPDISGSVTTASNDLVGNGSGETGVGNGGTNRVGVPARLAPLGDYGGPTRTFALLPNSPALGAGAVVANTFTDQCGYGRTGRPDIGAVQTPAPADALESAAMQAMSQWPQATTLNDPLGQGEVVTLQANNQLWLTTADGARVLLDNQARAIAAGVSASGQPALFDLKTDGWLYQYSAGVFTLLDNAGPTIAAGVTATGQPALFDLKSNLLYQYSVGGFTLLDNQAQTIATGVTASGQPALFDLKGNTLYQYSVGGFTLLDGQSQAITAGVTASGQPALFDLKTYGVLYQYSVGGFTLLDDQARTIAAGVGASGQPALFDLKSNGFLYMYSVGGFSLLDNAAPTIAAGVSATGQPALFDLKGNALYQYSDFGFTLLDSQAQTIWGVVPPGSTPWLYVLETNGRVLRFTVGGSTQVA
jgi:hypothetical protein